MALLAVAKVRRLREHWRTHDILTSHHETR
jgi:hypothetical protein